jgi:hypothetical protein
MTQDQANYKSAYDNLKPADRAAAVNDIQKALEAGGIDRIIAVELRELFLRLTNGEKA